jgi:hypothetical protein
MVPRTQRWHIREPPRRSERLLPCPLRLVPTTRMFCRNAGTLQAGPVAVSGTGCDRGEDDFVALGTLPREWITVRTMGSSEIDGVFADIYGVGWVSQLRRTLAAEALSSLERAEPRRLTQLASRQAYLLSFAGIFYRSRYGQTLENWAIFEPFPLEHATSFKIRASPTRSVQHLSILRGPVKCR